MSDIRKDIYKAETSDVDAMIAVIGEGVEIEEFDLNFLGFGLHKSLCHVVIFRRDDLAIVVMQDLGKGTSVTNASEQIATDIYRVLRNRDCELDLAKTVWLECYPYYGGDYDIYAIAYSFNPVTISLYNPQWKPVKAWVVVDFLRRTLKQRRA